MTNKELANQALEERKRIVEYCEYCADNVPPYGYWRCPVCDAEWPDNGLEAIERGEHRKSGVTNLGNVAIGTVCTLCGMRAPAELSYDCNRPECEHRKERNEG